MILMCDFAVLESYLCSEHAIMKLNTWQMEECPIVDDPYKLSYHKEAAAAMRIRYVIDQWDNEERLIQNTAEQIAVYFERELVKIRRTLEEIEVYLLGHSKPERLSPPSLFEFPEENKRKRSTSLSTRDKIILTVATAPIWLPLGLVCSLIAMPVIGFKKVCDIQKYKKSLKEYEADRRKQMANITDVMLQEWLHNNYLTKILQFKFDRLKEKFQQEICTLRMRIKADIMLIEDHQQCLHVQKSQHDVQLCCELFNGGKKIEGCLHYVYVRDLMQNKYTMTSFSDIMRVGEGSFSTVSSALVKPSDRGQAIQVALKRFKQPLLPEFATEFVQEEKNLK